MHIQNIIKTGAALGALALASTAQAGSLTPIDVCPSTTSTATVNGITDLGGIDYSSSNDKVAVATSALSVCMLGGTSTPDATDIGSAFGGSWVSMGGGNAPGSGNSSISGGSLTITLRSGYSWATDWIADWTVSDAFFTAGKIGVISMHVGNGGTGPDAWLWNIGTNRSGSVAYEGKQGVSNFYLWRGDGPTNEVPEPATLGLLGLGLAGVGFARRRKIAA